MPVGFSLTLLIAMKPIILFYGSDGRQWMRKTILPVAGMISADLDLSELPQGIFLVQIRALPGEVIATGRFTKN